MEIIQFGEGNFLRGFVEWIVLRMNEEIGFNASIAVVKPRPGNSLELLKAQGCRYHVNLQGLQRSTASAPPSIPMRTTQPS